LQCKGVVAITTTIEGSKMCLGTNNGECLKMAVGHQEFSTSFTCVVNYVAEDELEDDLLQQVMATTLEEELSPPCLDDVADYLSLAKEEAEFQDLEHVFLNGYRETPMIISDKLAMMKLEG
jgi:hypothetical protein